MPVRCVLDVSGAIRDGTVDMATSVGLEDAEFAAGYVLTCQAVPRQIASSSTTTLDRAGFPSSRRPNTQRALSRSRCGLRALRRAVTDAAAVVANAIDTRRGTSMARRAIREQGRTRRGAP